MDVSQLTLPIQGVVSIIGTIVSATISSLLWAVRHFETKADADEKAEDSKEKIKELQDKLIEIGNDVAFIRGRLEK